MTPQAQLAPGRRPSSLVLREGACLTRRACGRGRAAPAAAVGPSTRTRPRTHPRGRGRRPDVGGVAVGEARADQLPGPRHAVPRLPVGPGSVASPLGRAGDQGVADVQRQAHLQHGQEQQADQTPRPGRSPPRRLRRRPRVHEPTRACRRAHSSTPRRQGRQRSDSSQTRSGAGDRADGVGEHGPQLRPGQRPQRGHQPRGHQRDEHPAGDVTALGVVLARTGSPPGRLGSAPRLRRTGVELPFMMLPLRMVADVVVRQRVVRSRTSGT